MTKGAQFLGHIDQVVDGFMHGWIFDRLDPSATVCFELFIEGKYLGQHGCCYFREDLFQAGFGNGLHGFKIRIPPQLDLTTVSDSVEFFVAWPNATWLRSKGGTICIDKTAGLTRTSRRRRLRNQLERRNSGFQGEDSPPQQHAELSLTNLTSSGIYKDIRLAEIESSDFAEFIRRLFNKKGPDKDFYRWYINEYIYKIKPYFIPVSDDEAEFLKEIVEEVFREIHLRPRLPITTKLVFGRESYKKLVHRYLIYWWAFEGGRHLGLSEYCLSEKDTNLLHETLGFGVGSRFPLTFFMIIFALRNGLVSPLSMLFPSGRRRVYEWCLFYSQHNRPLAKVFPKKIPDHLDNGCKTSSLIHELPPAPADQSPNSILSRLPYDGTDRNSPCLIQFIGPFDRMLGLGESSRRLAKVFRRTRLDCRFVCYNEGIQSAPTGGKYEKVIRPALINVIHLNLEQIPEFFVQHGAFVEKSYNIVFPYWELSKLSSLHLLGLSLVDEVWTASNFIADMFRGGERPVFPMGMPAMSLGCRTPNSDNEFTFLTTFDAFSWPQRKNPLAVVDAFKEAFEGERNVRLVIKTQNAENVHTVSQRNAWHALKARCQDDPRIVLINETYSPAQQKELLRTCDCLVSLHRAEGLGIDILDALATGVPVIATGYSGNMDLCNFENSWLISYKLVPVSPDDYVFVENGHEWAEPDHNSAVKAFKQVFSDRTRRIGKAALGTRDAKLHNSVNKVSTKISRRLNELMGDLLP